MKKTISILFILLAIVNFFFGSSRGQGLAADPTPEPETDSESKNYLYDPTFLGSDYTNEVASEQIASDEQLYFVDGNAFGRYVYQAIPGDNFEIFLGGSGIAETQITYDPSVDVLPRLNRGSTKIAFVSDRGGDFEIYTMNPDGSGLLQLTNTVEENLYPFWSPDGTKILFQSYRDYQAEIYVMNADGSNPIRLTYDPDYDGQPSWSPDGSKIAFISRRTGGYRVYTMNPDGSEVVQLSLQPYSAHPVWSPDGTMIAYDADGDSNGWQDLYVMNSDGSNQRNGSLFGATQQDRLASGWTPGGEVILFTEVSWVYIDDQWYWYQAFRRSWGPESAPGDFGIFFGMDTEWSMDYQTTDGQPPSSSIISMPTTSPGPFVVSWLGADAISDIQGYHVQVIVGNGNWTDWKLWTTETAAIYPGLGGEIYSFRVRSRDTVFNWEAWPSSPDEATTVEAAPPRSSILLPPFLRNPSYINWTGTDPGNSGILDFDLEYRIVGNNLWTPWQSNTKNTFATFSGTPGTTYDFRIRGTDNAQNVEDWSSGGDAQTTLYTWGISGNAYDNAGAPVTDLNLSINPAPIATLDGPEYGEYAGYVTDNSGTYSAEWTKGGYGGLPVTTFQNEADALVDVVLPPIDNVIAEWGFESGSLGPNWNVSGLLTTTIDSNHPHTGQNAVFFGKPVAKLGSPTLIDSGKQGENGGFQLAQTSDDMVHILWTNNQGLQYTWRKPDGQWSGIQQTISSTASSPQMVMDDHDVLHLVWGDGDEIYYATKPFGENWTTPKNISNWYQPTATPRMLVEDDGSIHIVWSIVSGYGDVYYVSKQPNGVWSLPEYIGLVGAPGAVDFAVRNGLVHVIAKHDTYFLYAQRNLWGNWSEAETIYLALGKPSNYEQMVVTQDDIVHVLYEQDNNIANEGGIYYQFRNVDKVWSTAVKIASVSAIVYDVKMIIGEDDVIHAVWLTDGPYFKYYYSQQFHGNWSDAEIVPISGSQRLKWILDENNLLHLVAVNGGGVITYVVHDPAGNWLPHTFYDLWCDEYNWNFSLGNSGYIHILCLDYPYQNSVLYVGPPSTLQNRDVNLSQVITIPISMTAPTLSFLYDLDSPSSSLGGSLMKVQVNDGINLTTVFSTTSSTDNWQHAWADMSPWAGQTVTLTFYLIQETGYYAFSGALDEITLGTSHPDVWVNISPVSASSPPGREFSFAISYGNQGGAPANDMVITQTLPVGINFLSADPAPDSIGSQLVWNIGNLPAKSDTYMIIVTVTIDPQTPTFTTLTNLLEINTSSEELEILNNSVESQVFIAYKFYLPVITSE